MGMSSSVYGIRPPNERWRKMKEIYEACEKADIDPPEEVQEFFPDGEPPDPKGVVVDLSCFGPKYENHPSVTEYKGDMDEGFEVEIDKLPPDVKIIRFVNSW